MDRSSTPSPDPVALPLMGTADVADLTVAEVIHAGTVSLPPSLTVDERRCPDGMLVALDHCDATGDLRPVASRP